MPYSTYLPEHMGTITLSPAGPFVAGSHEELTLVYTAGTFGIDDTGMLKISWRTTSDMSKPQFDKPGAANFTTVEASNGAKLEVWFDRLNIRPWGNTLLIRVGRGYLRAGDTLTIRFGDRRQGSPGWRLQTNVEKNVELRTSVDAFAAYEFCELKHPAFDLVAGPAADWKAILPSLAVVGEPFRLAIVAEDMWGNPTADATQTFTLASSRPLRGLPETVAIKKGEGPRLLDGLLAETEGDVELRLIAGGVEIARANPLRVVRNAPLRRYWGDLHGQSGETIGMGSAEDYFRYARDAAFIDIVGHQGNDFQITDAFWKKLNELTAEFDAPGKFVCLPGYEWSGNTGMGGDRNVFYRREGRPIRRSSHILVQGETSTEAIYTADALFRALEGEDAIVIAHVGGRYADVKYAHDGRLERAVEVHSTWGTFEWLLHDAFEKGFRVGVVCHSDDHKGRPGATRPGASSFGAVGGLTCYVMPELTRDALFDALRQRHHYGTTGPRIFIDVRGTTEEPVTRFSDDPVLGPVQEEKVTQVMMGDIVRLARVRLRLNVEVIGTAPIERVDTLWGPEVVSTARGYQAADLGRRVRVLWQGAEYRGRGRETLWSGKLTVSGNRIARFAAVNFLNPERRVVETQPGTLTWTSVTTGNLAGIDLWLDEARAGSLSVETNVVSGMVDLASLADQTIAFDGGGLGRQLSVYRLPENDWDRWTTLQHEVWFRSAADLPIWFRVTQADGNQAWTSPIYLIA
ncbi:MAG: DUF3604 domain-containing protein [Xanthobacteraceae bacterium]